MKKLIFIFFLFSLQPIYGQYLKIQVINVGAGEAIRIECPEGKHQLFIDAGELNFRYPGSQDEYRNFITLEQDKNDTIDVVIASHPHSDHLGSMQWLVENYSIKLYVDNGRSYNSTTYENLEKAIEGKTLARENIIEDLPDIDFCTMEEVSAEILRPSRFNVHGLKVNDYSVVIRIGYGNNSFLFTGDAEEQLEKMLIEDEHIKERLNVDFLKVGHHGSSTSTNEDFIEVVKPKIAAISTGGKNLYTNRRNKHPRLKVINNLNEFLNEREGVKTVVDIYNKDQEKWESLEISKAVYFTSNEGDLIFYSDGDKIWKH